MQSYMGNGVRLGWLIDPQTSRIHIYQPGTAIEILESPETVSHAQILPAFSLDLKLIWKP
jgi:Uma2 family endonuclease